MPSAIAALAAPSQPLTSPATRTTTGAISSPCLHEVERDVALDCARLRVHGFPSSSRSHLRLVPVVGCARTIADEAEQRRTRSRAPAACRSGRRARGRTARTAAGSRTISNDRGEGVGRTPATSAGGRGAPLRAFPQQPNSPLTDPASDPPEHAACESIRNLWCRFEMGQTGRRFFPPNRYESSYGPRPARRPAPGLTPAAGAAGRGRPPSSEVASPVGCARPFGLLAGTRTPGWNKAKSSSARPAATNGTSALPSLRVGRARARRPRAARSTPTASRPCGAGRGRGA